MEKDELMDILFFSATSRELREEQLLNIFEVSSLDDIPTDKLLEYCNRHYCTKGGIDYGSKV